ncbi:MAG: hypothetical protein KDB03_01260 [Planctomycetales bacterium]|nr:hypothetical protein [Planctomycetales bacterium]
MPAWMVGASRFITQKLLSLHVACWPVSGCARSKGHHFYPILLIAFLTCWAVAQEPTEDPIGASLPDILSDGTLDAKARLWLSGDSGAPVLVPNMTLKEFLQLEDQTPTINEENYFDEIVLNVRISDDSEIAEVEGRFTVTLGARAEQKASIQLRMETCQLSETSSTIPDYRILASRDQPGWQWDVKGPANSQQTASIVAVTKIQAEGDLKHVRLSLPYSPCTINVLLPSSAVDFEVLGEEIVRRQPSSDGVDMQILSEGGEVGFSWRDSSKIAYANAIEASSLTQLQISDLAEPWLASTDVELRWYGRSAGDTIRIRLPQGARWRKKPASEFGWFSTTFVSRSPSDENTNRETTTASNSEVATDEWELVVKNYNPDNPQPIKLTLDWQWDPDIQVSGESSSVEVKVPQIEGTDIQSGQVECLFPAVYTVGWEVDGGTRLLSQQRLNDQWSQKQLAFQYHHRSLDLKLDFKRELSLPIVRPTYLVTVDNYKLTLTAWLECSFVANQDLSLGIVPGDWIIEDNTVRAIASMESPYERGEVIEFVGQKDGSYRISGNQLDLDGLPNSRRIDQIWRFTAERSWTSDDNSALEFQIPSIIRGLNDSGEQEVGHGSGVLLVNATDNLLLRWRETASNGLLPDTFGKGLVPFIEPLELRTPLAYRFQSSVTIPNWAGQAEPLPQQISYAQTAELNILTNEVQVVQTWQLGINNSPLADLEFEARSDVVNFRSLQLFVNGVLYPVATTQNSNIQDSKTLTWQVMQAPSVPALRGQAEVRVISTLPWQSSSSRNSQTEIANFDPIEVPLVKFNLPENCVATDQRWVIRDTSQYDLVRAAEDLLDPNLSPQTVKRVGEFTNLIGRSESTISVSVLPRSTLQHSAVSVGKSWLQTAITGDRRRDRFCAEIETADEQLKIQLPASADVMAVAVDAKQLEESELSYDIYTDSLTINLDATNPLLKHRIEVFYRLPQELGWATSMEVSCPKIENAQYLDRFYWQLATPTVQHLAWSPPELTAEWNWQWGGVWWTRASRIDQRGLEAWVGVSSQSDLPLAANTYVMSGFDFSKPLSVLIVSRFILWLPVGLLSISTTTLLLRLRPSQRPYLAFFLSVCAIAAGLIVPDLAVMVGHATVLSLGLVLLIFVTQSAMDSRLRRRSIFSSRPSTYLERVSNMPLPTSGKTSVPVPQPSSTAQ